MAVNVRQMDEVELLIPSCTDYIRRLWEQSEAVHGAKYLGIEVREEVVLGDVKSLIEIRRKRSNTHKKEKKTVAYSSV